MNKFNTDNQNQTDLSSTQNLLIPTMTTLDDSVIQMLTTQRLLNMTHGSTNLLASQRWIQ